MRDDDKELTMEKLSEELERESRRYPKGGK